MENPARTLKTRLNIEAPIINCAVGRCWPCHHKVLGLNSCTKMIQEGATYRDKSMNSNKWLEWMKCTLPVLFFVSFLLGPSSCPSQVWGFFVHMLTLLGHRE
jgi:hypothetical protein